MDVLTDEQLPEMAQHVCYEIVMMREAYALWAESVCPSFRRNLGLESMLLHIRILRDFFIPEKSDKRYCDNLMASDYLSDIGWYAKVATLGLNEIFEDTRERLNKQLAHLSVKRSNYAPDDYVWPMEELYRSISSLIEQFFSMLTPGQRDWFDQLI